MDITVEFALENRSWIYTMVMGNPGLGHNHFWPWLCYNVAEPVTHSILSSDGHNFPILSVLSSKNMYYKLNTTIILDLCSNVHP
jgi:hypothetical protein